MARARSKRRSPETLAAELLNRYEGRLPIDIKAIAIDLGCTVRESTLQPEVSGLLIRDNGDTIIAVNGRDALNRQRFTIAHEIGHLVMHPGRPLLVDADVRINTRTPAAGFAAQHEEREANQFAAALLMPLTFVRDEIEDIRGGVDAIDQKVVKKLAHRFGVSEAAMQYRLINLGLYMPL